MFTFLFVSYLILSVIAAGVVISACMISSRMSRRLEGDTESASENYTPVLVRKAA